MMGEEMMGEKKPEKSGYSEKEVYLKVPEGFDVPEGIKPGDTFEAMSTYRLKEDGGLCLEAVEGNELPGKKEESSEEMEDEGEEEYAEEEGEQEMPEKGRGKGGPAIGFLMAIEKGASKRK